MKHEILNDNPRIEIYCADCMEILPTLKDKSVACIITDPPWNVGKDYGVYKDNLSYNKYTNMIEDFKKECDRIASGRVAIVLGSEILKQWWDIFNQGWGEFNKVKVIIVKLGAIVLTRKNNFHLQWKAILTTCDSNQFSTDMWEDIRWPGEGYFFNEPRYGHPAMTPLKLMERLVCLFTQEGDTVIEPYLGVGTTGVACKKLNRNFIGIEISEKYYELAKTRINGTPNSLFRDVETKPEVEQTELL